MGPIASLRSLWTFPHFLLCHTCMHAHLHYFYALAHSHLHSSIHTCASPSCIQFTLDRRSTVAVQLGVAQRAEHGVHAQGVHAQVDLYSIAAALGYTSHLAFLLSVDCVPSRSQRGPCGLSARYLVKKPAIYNG